MALVMIIEDSIDVRNLLALALRGEGYATLTAGHGLEALDLLSAGEKPDFILLDLMMPVMDGREFLRRKNADAAISPIPLLVISALAEESTPLAGSLGFLRKPLDLGKLLDMISEHTTGFR